MTSDILTEKIINYIKEIPSFSVSVEKVLKICSNPFVNPVDLNHVISLDPVLTGKLLQLINSAYYALDKRVTSLVKAITMLGLNTVKNLTLSTAVLSTLPRNKEIEGINMEGFWYHCLCVGVTSRLLAAKQGIDRKYHEDYFTAGLLHDIGKIPINAILSLEYMSMVTIADKKREPLILAETECAGINHCASGEMIAKAWKLDDFLIDTIAYHHNISGYNGEYFNIVSTVAAANYFSVINEFGFAGDRKPEKLNKKIWDTLNLNPDIFEEIRDDVNAKIEQAKIFLSV